MAVSYRKTHANRGGSRNCRFRLRCIAPRNLRYGVVSSSGQLHPSHRSNTTIVHLFRAADLALGQA